MSETLLWTFQETARQLGVSVRTVQRLVKASGLPQVTMGRLCRMPASAVKNWVEINTQNLHNSDRVRQAVRDQQEIPWSESPEKQKGRKRTNKSIG